jgi:hypothetical protein
MDLPVFIVVFNQYKTVIEWSGPCLWISFTLLCLLNLYYLKSRVIKLEHKKYHLVMFTMLLVDYLLLMVSFVFFYLAAFYLNDLPSQCFVEWTQDTCYS